MRFWEAMKALEEGKKVRGVKGFCDKYTISINENPYSHLVELTKCEWELYQESAQTYTLQEIIPFLKEGKKVKRMGWNLDLPILLNACGDIVDTDGWLVGSCIRDLEASDWIVVE